MHVLPNMPNEKQRAVGGSGSPPAALPANVVQRLVHFRNQTVAVDKQKREKYQEASEHVWRDQSNFSLTDLEVAPAEGGTSQVVGNVRRVGKTRFLLGPDLRLAVLAFVLLLIPSAIFDIMTLPFFRRYRFAAPLLYFVALPLQISCLISFFYTCGADPGILPRQRNPNNAFDVNTQSFRMKLPPRHQDAVIHGHLVKLKYCSTCHIYRPPRTVHCAICDNCVEKFDHHCPWVGNCIGKRNYRRFVIFVVLTSLLCLIVIAVSVAKLWLVLKENRGLEINKYLQLLWDCIVCGVVSLGVSWFVFGLSGYHSYLIAANLTTYEQIKAFYDDGDNPWDRGSLQNAKEALFLPARPRYFDFDQSGQYVALSSPLFEPRAIGRHRLELEYLVKQTEKRKDADRDSGLVLSHVPGSAGNTGSQCVRMDTFSQIRAPVGDTCLPSDDPATSRWTNDRQFTLPKGDIELTTTTQTSLVIERHHQAPLERGELYREVPDFLRNESDGTIVPGADIEDNCVGVNLIDIGVHFAERPAKRESQDSTEDSAARAPVPDNSDFWFAKEAAALGEEDGFLDMRMAQHNSEDFKTLGATCLFCGLSGHCECSDRGNLLESASENAGGWGTSGEVNSSAFTRAAPCPPPSKSWGDAGADMIKEMFRPLGGIARCMNSSGISPCVVTSPGGGVDDPGDIDPCSEHSKEDLSR